MNFEIVGDIERIETIAKGSRLRERSRLTKIYGSGRWRKMKGVGCKAEIHWYEAHGIGKKEHKIKRILKT
jgi:hypothetical protein